MMVRLFKHYVPHAVLLLGMIDCVLLLLAGNLAWSLRALQVGMDPGRLADRFAMLAGFAAVVMAAIDNLLKGAASQAVQAFNVRFGLDEAAGLGAFGLNP